MASHTNSKNEMTTGSAEAMKPGEDTNTKPQTPHRGGGGRRPILLRLVRWLESLRIPQALVGRRGIQHSTSSSSSGGGGGSLPVPDGIPVISGLERVFFGTQPACETVQIVGLAPPRYLCYMISGFGCDLIQFAIDWMLHTILLLEDASLCWALGFGASVAFRHTSHRYLVFGDYVGGYWRSLGRMYAGYSIIIVLSTIFNLVMTHSLHLPHYVAWIVTLLWTGIVNYFILKKLWSFGGADKKNDTTTSKMDDDEGLSSFSFDDREGALSPPRRDVEMPSRIDRKLQARKTDHRR